MPPVYAIGAGCNQEQNEYKNHADSLLANGYVPLPIGPGSKAPGVYGGTLGKHHFEPADDGSDSFVARRQRDKELLKPPPVAGVTIYARHLTEWQSIAAVDLKPGGSRHDDHETWKVHPGLGVGVKCGDGLIGVDIDTEDPEILELARGWANDVSAGTPLVGKRGLKGWTLFFRAEEAIASRKIGTYGDLLGDGGRQAVLPPSLHPGTGQPYEWTTPSTLLDTPLAALPVITHADINDLFHLLGLAAPAETEPEDWGDRPAREESTIDAWARRHLPRWIPDLGLANLKTTRKGYVATPHWRAGGSGNPLEKRKRNLHIDSLIYDYGDQRSYTPTSLVAAALAIDQNAARAWLWARNPVRLPPPPPGSAFNPVNDNSPPPQPRHRVSLAEAERLVDAAKAVLAADWEQAAAIRQRLRNIAGEIETMPDSEPLGAFGVVVPHGRDPERLAELTAEEAELRSSLPPTRLWAFEAGLGKSTAAIELIAREAAKGRNIVIAVGHHGLAEQCRADLAKAGCSATVIKGIDQPGMCGRTAAREEVQRAGLSPWKTLCTELKRMPNGAYKQVPKCPRAINGTCPFYDMRMKIAHVQVVTHSHLSTPRSVAFPDGAEAPDILVIDESFISSLVPARDKDWSFDDLRNPPAPHVWDCGDLVRSGEIPYHVRDLWTRFADAQPATEGRSMHERLPAVLNIPGLQAALEYHGDQAALLKQIPPLEYETDAIARVTRQVGALLKDHRSRIALLLAAKEGASGRVWVRNGRLRVAPMKGIKASWLGAETSVLLLDATPPPLWAVASILGREIVPTVIGVDWSRDVDVVQVTGAPNRKRDSEKENGAVHQLARALGMGVDGALYVPRASAAGLEMPAGMSVRSPGKLVGLNEYKDSPLVVVAATGDAGVTAVERIVGIITGRLPEAVPCPERKNGGWQHPFVEHGNYPDAGCRDIWRWMVEGPIVQSAARARPIRRDGKTGQIVVFADESLSVPITRQVQWSDVDIGHAAEWLIEGKGCFSSPHTQARHLGWSAGARSMEELYKRGIRAALNALADGKYPLPVRVNRVRYRVPGGRGERFFIWIGEMQNPDEQVLSAEPGAEVLDVSLFAVLAAHAPQYSDSEGDALLTPQIAMKHDAPALAEKIRATMQAESFVCLNYRHVADRFGAPETVARDVCSNASVPDGWAAFTYRRAGTKGRPSAAYSTSLLAARKALSRYGNGFVVSAV